MARNGSGVYSLPAGNPVTTATTISSTWANNTLSDIATALTASIAKDGQTSPTANLPMGSFVLTGLGAGTADGYSLRYEQLFSQGAPTDIASAATTDIGAVRTNFLTVTGTTGITSLGTNYNGPKMLRFSGALTLTHNATTLVLPGATNLTTVAGDTCVAIPKSTASGTPDGWNIVMYSRAAGYAVAGAYAATGANSDITSLTACTTITGLTTPIAETRQIQPISASVAANALTISASALALEFRSATLTSGTVSFVKGTPANLVISSGSTLGTVSAQQSRIAVLALNNAGTIELAAVNISGGTDLTETGVISTTAEGGAGAADSATVIYSTTARTGVAYRVIGYVESTQATAGTWATAPSTIQGYGGQALAAMSSFGYGQTPQNLVGSRLLATTYYNTTGRPIFLSVGSTTGNIGITLYLNGVSQGQRTDACDSVIPPGYSYRVEFSAGAISVWTETK